MRTVAIINRKGGVGKTTTAVNVGAALALRGRRVLLVDCDPQANLSDHVGHGPESVDQSLYDVLVDGLDPNALIRPTDTEGLDLLPAHPDLAAAEAELAGEIGRETRLRRALAQLDAERFDWVLIDCPPSLGLLSLNAMVAANELILTVQTEYFAMRGLGHVDEVIGMVREHVNPELRILGILATLVNPVTRLSREVLEEIRSHYGELVFQTKIRQNIRLAEAPGHQTHIFAYQPNSAGAEDYRSLADELEGSVITADPPRDDTPEAPDDDIAVERIANGGITGGDITGGDITGGDITGGDIAVEDIAVEDIAVEDIAHKDNAHEDIAEENVADETADAATDHEPVAEDATDDDATIDEQSMDAPVLQQALDDGALGIDAGEGAAALEERPSVEPDDAPREIGGDVRETAETEITHGTTERATDVRDDVDIDTFSGNVPAGVEEESEAESESLSGDAPEDDFLEESPSRRATFDVQAGEEVHDSKADEMADEPKNAAATIHTGSTDEATTPNEASPAVPRADEPRPPDAVEPDDTEDDDTEDDDTEDDDTEDDDTEDDVVEDEFIEDDAIEGDDVEADDEEVRVDLSAGEDSQEECATQPPRLTRLGTLLPTSPVPVVPASDGDVGGAPQHTENADSGVSDRLDSSKTG